MPECILKAIVRPMSRKDIFYGGSVMQLAEEQVGRVLNYIQFPFRLTGLHTG